MGPPSRFLGWRMVALAFLTQNLGVGLIYGAFGPIVGLLERQVGMTRVQSAFGLSTIILVLSMSTTVAGSALSKRSLRWAMTAGLIIESVAWIGLSVATNFAEYILAYAAFGVTIGVASIIAPLLLLTRWFNAKRTVTLAIVNTPLFLALTPWVTGSVLPLIGLHATLWIYAGMCLTTALLVGLLLVERPQEIGQVPLGGELAVLARAPRGSVAAFSLGFLRNWRFWTIALGLGCLNAVGNSFFVHIVAYATEAHLSLRRASMLVFAYGAAGILGTPICGWIADRIGAVVALAIIGLLSAVFWGSLLLATDMTTMLVLCGFYGSYLSGIVGLQGASVVDLFPPEQVGRAAGSIYLVQLPLIFALPPLVSLVRVNSHSYVLPFKVLAGVSLIAMALILGTALGRKRGLVAAPA